MRRALAPVALLAVLLVLLAACGGGDDGPRVVQAGSSDDGASIELAVGDRLRLVLASNPTTGYEWVETTPTDPAVLELVETTYVPDEADEDVVGSGGHQVLVYEAVASGSAQVALAYLRGFEDGSTIDEFALAVTVAG